MKLLTDRKFEWFQPHAVRDTCSV